MHCRHRNLAAGLLALCLPLFPAQRTSDPPLVIAKPVTVARGLTLSAPIGSAMAPDGSFYVADRVNNQIYHMGTDGAVMDTIGGPGAGPGEFGTIYRVGVNRITGDLYAFDFARNEINHFSRAGKFLKRAQLPFIFSQVDAIVPLDAGGIAVSAPCQAADTQRTPPSICSMRTWCTCARSGHFPPPGALSFAACGAQAV